MRTILLIIIISTVFTACNNESTEKKLTTDKDSISQVVQTAASLTTNQLSLPKKDELTMGVCRLQQGNFEKFVLLYNENGEITDTISLQNESEPALHPWANKTDYGILVFRVIKQHKNYYKVIADEDKQRIAYLKKDDPVMEFQTWDQHILKTFSIEFDEKENPLRKQPDAQSAAITIKDDGDIVFHPVTIQDEWMQVEWGNGSAANKGWIRWKNGNKRLVEFYYLS